MRHKCFTILVKLVFVFSFIQSASAQSSFALRSEAQSFNSSLIQNSTFNIGICASYDMYKKYAFGFDFRTTLMSDNEITFYNLSIRLGKVFRSGKKFQIPIYAVGNYFQYEDMSSDKLGSYGFGINAGLKYYFSDTIFVTAEYSFGGLPIDKVNSMSMKTDERLIYEYISLGLGYYFY